MNDEMPIINPMMGTESKQNTYLPYPTNESHGGRSISILQKRLLFRKFGGPSVAIRFLVLHFVGWLVSCQSTKSNKEKFHTVVVVGGGTRHEVASHVSRHFWLAESSTNKTPFDWSNEMVGGCDTS